MSVTGKFPDFNEDVEVLDNYLERFEFYVTVNSIKSTDKVPLFLTVIGPKIYATLKNLVMPDLVKDQSYEDLVKILKAHFTPEKSKVAQRCKFHKRFQRDGETLSQYAVEIKQLAGTCEFGSFLKDAMRDRFVSGIRSEEIQQKLLTEKDASFEALFELACQMESAKQEVKNFHLQAEPVGEVDYVKSNSKFNRHTQGVSGKQYGPSKARESPQSGFSKGPKCYRCGKTNHSTNKCYFKNAKCFSCGKLGHVASACRLKQDSGKPSYVSNQGRGRGVNYCTEPDDEVRVCYELNNISTVDNSASKMYCTTLIVEGKPTEMTIDTGASTTCMPRHVYDDKFKHIKLDKTRLQLRSYTGHALVLRGEFQARVTHQGKDYVLPVVVVESDDKRQPVLLGRNWLKHLRLDWNQIFQVGSIPGKCTSQVCNNNEVCVKMEKSLREKYAEVFEGPMGLIKGVTTEVVIDEEATPIFCKARPVPYAMRDKVEKELDRLVKADIVYPVKSSNWATPLVCVNKPDGNVRLCGDFKVTLNRVLKNAEHYPLPIPEDIFTKLSGGKVFSKVDLTSAYLQLQVGEQSQPLLTMNTHLGLYRYKRLPFGITSAPFQFQAAMDQVLSGLEDTHGFLDDIICVGFDLADGARKTEALLRRLQQYGVKANAQKSELLKSSLNFLGVRIDSEGIHPTEKLMRAIVEAPEPTNITQLRAYLGLLNFYGRFLPNLATELHPLHRLLQKDCVWSWDNRCSQAFQKSKALLEKSQVLVPYNPKLKIELSCDASAYGIASVMSHVMPDGEVRPVAFASRTLTKAEVNYCQLDKEALAIVFGVKKYHKYIYGRTFTLITDHAPLTALLGEKKPIPAHAAARLVRWAIILSAYDYKIVYRKGTEIVEADTLSRLPRKIEESGDDDRVQFFAPFPDVPLTAHEIGQATRKDPIFSKVLDLTLHGWPGYIDKSDPLRPFFVRKDELSVELGCVLWGGRVLIPNSFQKSIINMLHEEHPGICRMKSLARSYVWWPKLDEQIEKCVNSCNVCQMSRKSMPKVPLHSWTCSTRKWQRVHADFAKKDGVYFLVIIDSFSKWVEVFQMSGTNAAKTMEKLRTCFSAYGIPENLVTDGGPPFHSEEFEGFLSSNGINHLFSPPYHPASNGQAESMVGIFKTALLKQVLQDNYLGPKRTLQHKLDCFLFSYRNTPHSVTGKAPSELFLGFQPRTRLSLLKPHFMRDMESKQAKTKEWCDRRRGPERIFSTGEHVLVRSVRNEGVAWIPGTIIKVVSASTYIANVLGQKRFVHADHLKHTDVDILGPKPTSVLTPARTEVRSPRDNVVTSPTPSPLASPGTSMTSPTKVMSPHKIATEKTVEPADASVRTSKRIRRVPQRLDL